MMPPLPILLAFIVLIGYPLVQIAAIKLRRQKRLSYNQFAEAWLDHPSVEADEKDRIQTLVTRSRGSETFKALLRLPVNAFVHTLRDTQTPRLKPVSDAEHRLHYLKMETLQLELATWPIASAVSIPLALGAWAIAAAILWLQKAAAPHFPTVQDLGRAMLGDDGAPAH